MKNRTRDRFLMEYAQVVRRELNQYVEGSGAVHRASVLAGSISQVIIEVLGEGQPWEELRLTRQSDDWLPSYTSIIEFQAPNKIMVTRPSKTLEQMLAWSNVKAWDDTGYIIGHILAARRRPEPAKA